ncbi:MAG TPA: hypothetical protein VIR34_10735 [Gemmatimonadaceae bacterium]
MYGPELLDGRQLSDSRLQRHEPGIAIGETLVHLVVEGHVVGFILGGALPARQCGRIEHRSGKSKYSSWKSVSSALGEPTSPIDSSAKPISKWNDRTPLLASSGLRASFT